MLINTETTIALRCSVCGKLDFHGLSLFALVNGGKKEVKCACGASKLIIGYKKDNYWVQINCIYCEQKHFISFKRKELMAKRPIAFYCHETDLDLGFIGSEDKLEELAENLQDNFTSALEQEDYFENPKIMFEVLNILHDIAEEDDLYCHCGNHNIEIDILSKGIELRCSKCSSSYILPAEKEEDLWTAKKLNNIVINKKDYKPLDRAEKNNL